MTTYDQEVKHVNLVANTVSTVTFTNNHENVEVINVDGAASVYFTCDGPVATIKGDNCFVVPAAISSVTVPSTAQSTTSVSLISTGTPNIAIRAF